VSKESKIKKNLERIAKQNAGTEPVNPPPKRTSRPGSTRPPFGTLKRPVRRLNKRFIITAAIWFAALIAAIFFLTQR
jgi:hypothetical protein